VDAELPGQLVERSGPLERRQGHLGLNAAVWVFRLPALFPLSWATSVALVGGPVFGVHYTEQASATRQPLPNSVLDALITDPPYYYSVPYADLADFFYVWLRRLLRDIHPSLFATVLTPKREECIQNLPMPRWRTSKRARRIMKRACGKHWLSRDAYPNLTA